MKPSSRLVIFISICGFIYFCEGGSLKMGRTNNNTIATQNRSRSLQEKIISHEPLPNNTRKNNIKKINNQRIAPNKFILMKKTVPRLNESHFTPSEWQEIVKNVTNFQLDSEPTGKSKVPMPVQTPSLIRSQIIGGHIATAGQAKYLVSMTVDSAFLCGGAAISKKWVVTAAHCTNGFSTFTVLFGALDRSANSAGRTVRNPTTKIIHSNFKPSTLLNDISLLKLTIPIILNEFIDIVRLPKKAEANSVLDGTNGTVCGFGLTKEAEEDGEASQKLKCLTMKVLPNPECYEIFGTYLTSTNICCESKVDGTTRHSTCSGDSGGPLVKIEKDGLPTLFGIVSYGLSAGCSKAPSVFTRVNSYLGWISTQTDIEVN